MQMVHALPRIPSRVSHDPVAICIEAVLRRKFGGKCKQAAQQSFSVWPFSIADRSDVTGRYHQEVNRGLGIDVSKCQRLIRAFHDLRWDFVRHDLAKQTVSHRIPAVWLAKLGRQRRVLQSRIEGCVCRASPEHIRLREPPSARSR